MSISRALSTLLYQWAGSPATCVQPSGMYICLSGERGRSWVVSGARDFV
jgi:hypothetical protein